MHILLTNDDGPPSAKASPYIATLVRALRSAGHTVSVVIPSQQRSWIGKAHLLPPTKGPNLQDKPQPQDTNAPSKNENVSDLITPRYWLPDTQPGVGEGGHVVDELPNGNEGQDYWILVPGTPAACTQLGLFHLAELFPSAATPPQIDLVLSGPNLGRNTSAAFALSSGTLGGALEAAICGRRAVALSFAHFTRSQGIPETQEVVQEACELSVKVVEKLVQDWDIMGRHADGEEDALSGVSGGEGRRKDPRPDIDVPDLYTINVPLVEGVLKGPVHWTWMLNNRWTNGSLYAHVATTPAVLAQQNEDTVGSAAQAAPTGSSMAAPSFRWSPTFGDVFRGVEESMEGNDGKTIMNKLTSVTALKATLMDIWGRAGFEGTMKL